MAKKGHVFVKDGHPVGFFLNPNIKGHGQREQLRANIEAYGGRVVNKDVDADTVLVDPKFTDRDSLQRCYDASNDSRQRKIYVEKTPFVQHCIRYGFRHILPVRKGMGGQVGRKRIAFTKEDDMHLCQFLARLMPDKRAGGRQGLKIYETLMGMAEVMPKEYAWVKRHTVESWKERYKNMAENFDPLIEEIARKEKTSEKQLWKEDRRASGKKRRRMREEVEEDEEEEEEEGENEEGEEENEEEEVIEIIDEAQEEMEDEMDREWVGQELFEPGQWENDGDIQGSHGPENFEVLEENTLNEQRAVVDSSDRIKRRRSEHGPTAARTAKRKRSEQDDDSPVQQARNKGKRRSYEQEKDDEEVHNTNGNDGVPFEQFEDFDEPGPSNTLRSPDRTLPGPLSSSRMAHTTSLTQETLVNPTNSHQMESFEPLSQSTSANRRHSGSTTQSRFPSREQSPVIPPSPSPHPSAQRSGNMVFEIDPTSGMVLDFLQPPPTLEAANPQMAARSPTQVRRGPKPRPVKRQLLSTVRAGYDPPYRNTRSRSRSVEPVAFREPQPKLKTKKKDVILEEVEVEEVPLEVPRDSAPVAETIEEEMDVENLLKVDGSNQSILAPARELSLETDDAQTRQDLHPALPLTGITFMSNKINPSDVLHKFAQSTGSSRRFSVPPVHRPVVSLNPKNTRPRQSEPQGGRPHQLTNRTTGMSGAGFKHLERHTPVQVPHLRGSSMSSTELFPLQRTRASAKKKEQQEIEKHTPYKPPQGTRAAQFAK